MLRGFFLNLHNKHCQHLTLLSYFIRFKYIKTQNILNKSNMTIKIVNSLAIIEDTKVTQICSCSLIYMMDLKLESDIYLVNIMVYNYCI